MMKKLYRKYSNRRLYDVEKKEYVNLDDIKDDIMNFHPVEIIDAKTKKDITSSILLQIINKQEEQSVNKIMTNQALINLILLYESPFATMASQYLDNYLTWLNTMSFQGPPPIWDKDKH